MSAPWEPSVNVCDWLLPRFLELTYTAWNLKHLPWIAAMTARLSSGIPSAASNSGAR